MSSAAATDSLPQLWRALLPAGSITGAPKAAAMHLLRQLEEKDRGAYCGSIACWPAAKH